MADLPDLEQSIAKVAKRLRCKGPLKKEEIARGAHLCWLNAVSLLADVRLLVSKARFARSLAMTVLALEELAKPALLFEPLDDVGRWAKFWRDEFSRHSAKQMKIGKYGKWLRSIGLEIYQFSLSPSTVEALDSLKQWGFYVDCVEGSFQSPEQFAESLVEVLDYLFAVAEERADSFAQFHASHEQSLWIYEVRSKFTRHGEFWPPPIRSDAELHGLLLSLASKYSLPNPPAYLSFDDAANQLSELNGRAMVERALSVTGRVCSGRAQFQALPTAAARGLSMMKLCLHAMHAADKRATLKKWKEQPL